jgi:hypothetical protein
MRSIASIALLATSVTLLLKQLSVARCAGVSPIIPPFVALVSQGKPEANLCYAMK